MTGVAGDRYLGHDLAMAAVQAETFSVRAHNLAEHARNAIHTDAGARAAGFPLALVAGVTTYAYLTHPPAALWGLDWVRSGGGEVRFMRPVFEHDLLDCVPHVGADGTTLVIDGCVGEGDRPRAVFSAVAACGVTPPPLDGGERLRPMSIELTGEWGDYGARAGDTLAIYAEHGIVHPAVWPALANAVVHTQLARGSWIHTRSIVRHHALVPISAVAVVSAAVVDRFNRTGERVVLDVRIEVDGALVASLEHEAIIALGTSSGA